MVPKDVFGEKLKSIEDKIETKYIRNLKKQITTLKRENAQLRKKVNRLESNVDDYVPDEPILDPPSQKTKKESCDSCGSYNTNRFEAGVFEFLKCQDCSFSKKHKLIS